jgi:hypothetical protein
MIWITFGIPRDIKAANDNNPPRKSDDKAVAPLSGLPASNGTVPDCGGSHV